MSENTQIDNEQNIDPKNTNTEAEGTGRVSELEAEVAKLTAIIKRRKEKEDTVSQEDETQVEENQPIINNNQDSKLERLELKVEGYPDHVIDSIIKNGGKKALEDPIYKRVVSEMVQEHKNEIASNIDTGSKSDWEKKYSEKDLANMSVEELEKILPHAQD